MTNLYRVDSELLTLEPVPKENLPEGTPIGYWIPVLIGTGAYCYCETEEEAKQVLTRCVKDMMDDLKAVLKKLGEESDYD